MSTCVPAGSELRCTSTYRASGFILLETFLLQSLRVLTTKVALHVCRAYPCTLICESPYKEILIFFSTCIPMYTDFNVTQSASVGSDWVWFRSAFEAWLL